MTTEVLAQQLVANQQATFGAGRMWYLKTATGPVSVTAESSGTGAAVRKFTNVSAGFKFVAVKGDGWTYLRVLSVTSQNIEIVVGDDDVQVAGAVSVVGTVITAPAPSGNITASGADTVIATGSAYSIPQNVGRRRITIGSLSTNTGSVRVQSAGAGANRGLELQAGSFVQFDTTSALDVRNDSGAAQTVYQVEES
jgi:hypothetical protein